MHCSPAGWSAVSSASANAVLAAVLAGFMINGMVLVLGRKPEEMKPEYVRALSLMFAAFVVLGLDAYLFGFVTGDNHNVGACRRVWTEAMFAAGLLAIGAVAIVVGFVMLFDAYLGGGKDGQDPNAQARNKSLHLLMNLCNLLRRVVAFVVVGLLWIATRSYLFALFNGHIPALGNIFLWVYLAGILLALVLVIVEAIRRKIFGIGPDSPVKAFEIAIYSSVFYSAISVGLAGYAASQPIRYWGPTSPLTRVMICVAVVWVLVVSLVPLWFQIVSTVPNFTDS
jgi:hypothetical protein